MVSSFSSRRRSSSSRVSRARSTVERGLRRERADQLEMSLVVGVERVALEIEDAERAALDQQRRRQLASASRDAPRRSANRASRPATISGSPVFATQPTMPCPTCRPKRIVRAFRVADLAHQLERLRRGIHQVDRGRVVAHDLAQRLEDRLDHLVEIERRRRAYARPRAALPSRAPGARSRRRAARCRARTRRAPTRHRDGRSPRR